MAVRPLRTYAVIGLLDPRGDAFIRTIWRRLSRAGIACGVTEYHGSRPHVTFSIFAGCGKRRAAAIAAAIAAGSRPLRIELTHIDFFTVADLSAYIGIAATRPLRSLNRRIDAAAAPCADEMSDYYRPGRWVPHCTLSSALEQEQLTTVRNIANELMLPRRFTLYGLGLTELDHERQVWSYERDFPFAR